MRALVAEANVVTRVTLRRLLERAGFSVEELRDELAAACLVYQPDPPELALLALDTLLVDFEAVCGAMRAAKPEVFIVALVPENRRHDLGTVLDAGADDFIIKPAILQEAEARLRLIGRLLATIGGSPLADAGTAPGWAAEAPAPRPRRQLSQFLARLDVPQAFTTVFTQMGLGPVGEAEAAGAPEQRYYTAWAPLLVRRDDRAQWLNVRIDLDRPNAEGLFRAVYPNAPYAEAKLVQLLREIITLAQDGIRATAAASEAAEVYLPVPPLSLRAELVPEPAALASPHARERAVGFVLAGDLRLRIVLTTEPVPLETRVITELRRMDVLAAPIESAEYQTMLLRAGAMLNETYINKIRAFVHARNTSQGVQVFHPPPGTAAFLDELDVV